MSPGAEGGRRGREGSWRGPGLGNTWVGQPRVPMAPGEAHWLPGSTLAGIWSMDLQGSADGKDGGMWGTGVSHPRLVVRPWTSHVPRLPTASVPGMGRATQYHPMVPDVVDVPRVQLTQF